MSRVTSKNGKVIVTLSAQEMREALEHAAWCAAVDNDPSIAVEGDTEMMPYGDGYRVSYNRKE